MITVDKRFKMNIRRIIKEEIEKIFLFEESGVPKEIVDATYRIVDKISKNEKTIYEDEWTDIESKEGLKIKAKSFSDTMFFQFDNLFFEGVFISIEFLKLLDKTSNQKIKTNSTRAELKRSGIRFNSDKSKIKSFRMDVRICYTDRVDKPYVYGVISHELEHLYEFFKKKEVYLSKKHEIYNEIRLRCGNNQKLSGLVFLFYCMCYFELNANIVALYHELFYGNGKSYKDLFAEYYQTSVYSEFLINLEKPELILSDEYINSLSVEDLIEINNSIEGIIKDFGIVKNTKIGAIKYRIGEGVENYIVRIRNYCKKVYSEYLKNVERVIRKVEKDKLEGIIRKEHSSFGTKDKFIIENNRAVCYKNYFKNTWGWDFDC